MTSSPSTDYRRIAVIAPGRRMDLVVPGDLPIADLVPEVLNLARLDGLDGHDGNDGNASTTGWRLGRIGGPGFAVEDSLDDIGVRDGDLLMLRPADLPDPLPIVDVITDVTAAVAAEQGPRRGDHSSRLALVAAAGVLSAAVPAAWVHRTGAVGPLTLVTLALVLSALVARTRQENLVATVLGVAGLGYGAITGVGALGPSRGAELLVAGGVLVVGTPVLAGLLGTGRRTFTALTTVAGFGMAAGATSIVADAGTTGIAVGTLVAATSVLPWAPRLAARWSRLPHSDSRPSDDGPSLPRLDLDTLQRAARTALAVLTGIDLGLAVVTGSSAVVLVATGERWPTVLAALGVLALLLRARSVQIAAQAAALALPAVATLLVALVIGTSRLPSGAGPWVPVGAAAVAAVVLVGGVVGPRRQWSPTAHRAARMCETVTLLAVVPVAVAAVQGYGLIRHG